MRTPDEVKVLSESLKRMLHDLKMKISRCES